MDGDIGSLQQPQPGIRPVQQPIGQPPAGGRLSALPTFELAGGATTTQPPLNLGQPVGGGGPQVSDLRVLSRHTSSRLRGWW